MSATVLPALPPTHVWRGSCTARCAHTGRRCALPAHPGPDHASGRYRFTAVAPEGQTHFAGAAALDVAAQRRMGGHPNE